MAAFLYTTLPVAIGVSPGGTVGLDTILDAAFGAGNHSFSEYWIAYYGAASLSSFDFTYWNPAAPDVPEWLVNGVDIGPDFNHQRFIAPGQTGTVLLSGGNVIAPDNYLTVPIALSGGSVLEYAEFRIVEVPSNLMSLTASSGTPNPADVVAAAQRYASVYSGIFNDNDCHNIAQDIAAAAGATLPQNSGSINPVENVEGGFWRIAYRGSDPNAVANWQSLVQPGDIVRMGWQAGSFHTTTILSANPDGTITVYDNGGGSIAVRTVRYDTQTVPSTVTIYRLSSDHLYLTQGTGFDETLHGSVFNDDMRGGDGNDTLFGAIGSDVLSGQNGDDTLVGGAGADTLDGGPGLDAADYGQEAAQGGGQSVSVDLLGGYALGYAGGLARDGFGAYDRLFGIEKVIGTALADSLYGTNSGDNLLGGDGSDLVVGWDGNDSVDGGAGDDVILGWTGNDTLLGGAGSDWLWAGDGSDGANGGDGNDVLVGDLPGSAETGADYLVGGLGADILIGGAGSDTLVGGAEATDGSDPGAQDWLIGGSGDDVVYAGSGDDVIWEQLDPNEGGNDTVFAGDGNDLILTGSGNDTIYAWAGDDTIYGGAGLDTITTGSGSDIVWFTSAADAGDTVADFVSSQDRAVLYPVLGGGMSTAQAFAQGYFYLGAFGSDTLLMYDADGSAGPSGAVMLADFLGHTPASFNIGVDFV
jgi:Ca2+-binding RTX toxin-like protein